MSKNNPKEFIIPTFSNIYPSCCDIFIPHKYYKKNVNLFLQSFNDCFQVEQGFFLAGAEGGAGDVQFP